VLRIRIQDEFFPDYKSLIPNGIRDLKMFFRDVFDPAYRMEKIRIRDKHPRTTRLLNIPDPQHCIHFRYRFSHPGSGSRGKKGTGSQIWIGKHWIILTKCIF
jgi:hypothetical protein